MSNRDVFSTLLVTWVAMPCLAVFLGAGLAMAQSSSTNYIFLVGAGFLCDSGDSATCPAVVKSNDGASYEMSGAGTFATQGKSVTAAGTFTHKSTDGTVLEAGVWIASELVSFDSYGIAPGALTRGGWAFGPSQFGPMRLRMFSGSMPAGGLALFRIRLFPVRGLSKNATLEVNCALGKVPEERPTEGIRLRFKANGGEFDQEISGRTSFLMTRLPLNPAAKPGAAVQAAAPTESEATPSPAEEER